MNLVQVFVTFDIFLSLSISFRHFSQKNVTTGKCCHMVTLSRILAGYVTGDCKRDRKNRAVTEQERLYFFDKKAVTDYT